jgi:hypothetical protein
MAAPIKFKKAVGKDAETQPAIRVDCRGARQTMYLRLRKIAEETYMTRQSTLAAMILEDFVKEYDSNQANPRAKRVMQMALGMKYPPELDGKKGPRPGGR